MSDHISAFWDVLPTLSDLTDEPIKGETDGISMLPTLGKPEAQKKGCFIWELYESNKPNCAVRYNKWKGVVLRYSVLILGLKIEISMISQHDQGELKNVAKNHPAIVSKIEQMMSDSHIPNPFWDKANKPLFNAQCRKSCNRTLKEILPILMRTITLLTYLLYSLHLFGQNESNKPNIILFLVDDMGLMDTSVPMLVDKEGSCSPEPPSQRILPHAQHGTPGQAGNPVFPVLCPVRLFPYPGVAYDRSELCEAPCYPMD